MQIAYRRRDVLLFREDAGTDVNREDDERKTIRLKDEEADIRENWLQNNTTIN